jgi:hypothetical protein
MGLLEFNKLPINTLVGADWKTFKAITAGREIDPAYRGKYRLTKAVCRLLSTLAPLQEKRYRKLLADKPLEHDPVFILGHWRSGTTFMHNVFSCDKHFGYNTTYQTVGMIIDRVEAKDMLNAMEVPTLNLAAMGIGEEHYEAIEKVVKELDRQGISVKIEK